MATDKTAYTAVDGGPSPPSLPGQPTFPVAFDMNMSGPNMFGAPAAGGFPVPPPAIPFGPGIAGPQTADGGLLAPGGLPFPPPIAFRPGVPGDFPMATNPQGGPGYGPNPSSPYFPPSQGTSGNLSGLYF